MANHKSAEKRARQTVRRTEVNTARRSRVRSFVKQVEEAIAGGDRSAAMNALKQAQPEIQRSVKKGVLHRNTASRKISRLAHRIKGMSEAS
jgi:small subunit ribosomal protein S20